MKQEKIMIHKLLLLSVIFLLPAGLIAQEVPGDGVPPDENTDSENGEDGPPDGVPKGPPDGVPQGPPQAVADFLEQLRILQDEFLTVVHTDYEDGQARAAAIQEWLEENRPHLDALEEMKDQMDVDADEIEVPEEELVGDIGQDIEDLEEAEEEIENSLGAIMSGDFDSEEERLQAIEDWKAEHAPEIAAQEAARENILARIEAARANSQGRGERPEASQNMRDLEDLFDNVLANVGVNNEELRDRLKAAEEDRQARLDALEEARNARLQDMEAARDLAKQQREEARQNIDAGRRPPDD